MKQRDIGLLSIALLLSACGGGSGSSTGTSTSAVSTISGTVPGTTIEAFGDNGSYYRTTSTDNGTSQHPFSLSVPAGVGVRLAMITNEGTSDEVVTPIGFKDNQGNVKTRLVTAANDNIDLGHINLAMSRNAAASRDLNNDGVLDSPYVLDDDADAHNPLQSMDTDKDGVNDYDDPDHGNYQYAASVTDPQDDDGDGIPNKYDSDYSASADDSDGDGLKNTDDVNPNNVADANSTFSDDTNGDGYHDDDANHDGYHDDDANRDGYHDDDLNHDGQHDDIS